MEAALLSGRSIVAYARGQETGREFAIRSECWGTEWGPRWLESGVCELPSEGGRVKITHERFDTFYEPEIAVIFVREIELQRLIDAKPSAEAQSAEAPAPRAPMVVANDDGPVVRLAKELMDTVFPRGEWRQMGPRAVRKGCEQEVNTRRVQLPSSDSFSRAMGRRRK
jgi:hypothetical protein